MRASLNEFDVCGRGGIGRRACLRCMYPKGCGGSSLWGSADIFNAFFQANRAGLLAGQLGAAYFLPTVVVPLLLITHGLAFLVLLIPRKGLAMREGRYAA